MNTMNLLAKIVMTLGIVALGLPACEAVTDPDAKTQLGLATTDRSAPGPTIVFDPLRKPQPEIPFPNDLALRRRADGTTLVNISGQGETRLESNDREHFNRIDGFSGLTPISVAFDGPIDLTTVTDQTVYVVNIQAGSKRFGERLPLDLGRGWFPQEASPYAYFPLDPYAGFDSYVLPPDNKVDSDGDGMPDKWVYHYETLTHTLDIRPLLPMESGAQYAVVLTRGVKGWDKQGNYGPVRSPFDIVNHDTQTADLERALPGLKSVGVERKDVAFAWTLTTGDLSRTFTALRDGLYGKGQFAWLEKEFPAQLHDIYDMQIAFDGDGSYGPLGREPYPVVPWDTPFVLQGAYMEQIVGLLNQFVPAGGFNHVSHVVFGDMDTVNLRATPDNVWRIDVPTGTVEVDKSKFHEHVPFMLTVPRTTEQHKPPFPVVVYAHATGTSRIEALLMANKLAQAGIAVFSIDAVGHGPVLADPLKFLADLGGDTDYLPLLRALLPQLIYADYEKRFPEGMSDSAVVTELLKNGFMQQLAEKGRATDDNGDCWIKASEAYYAPNAFRLRDAMRQTTLDYIVAVRALRSLTQAKVPAPPAIAKTGAQQATRAEVMPSLLAGDFDLDGKVDLGGPDVPYFMMGISLGGIHTALTAPLEPYIAAAAPVVPGAGLADIFMRTKLHGIVTPLMLAIGGPKVVACPQKDKDGNPIGKVRLSWNDDSDRCKAQKRKTYRDPVTGQCLATAVTVPTWFAEVPAMPGMELRLTNVDKDLQATSKAAADGSFAFAVPADKGDKLRLEVLDPTGKILQSVTQVTPYEGLGKERNTPDFRKFVQLAANVLEGADAITVADRVLLDPQRADQSATNMLMMLAVLDHTVPFTTGVTLARSTGLFGRGDQLGPTAPYRKWFEQAIASGLLVNKDVPPPPLSPNASKPLQRLCSLVETVPGKPQLSGLCLADVHGRHEYLAQADNNDSFPTLEGKAADGKPYRGTFTEFHKNLIVSYFHSVGKTVLDDLCWGDARCVKDQQLDKAWEAPGAWVK